MSLDKAIEHGKEHRKKYRGSKVFDYSCRNNGGCPCCEGNRLHKFKQNSRQLTMAELEEEDDEEYQERLYKPKTKSK